MGQDALRKSLVPDINLSASYTKRNHADGLGDFVGIGVAFPIPVSQAQHGKIRSAGFELQSAKLELENYRSKRNADIARSKHFLNQTIFELESLNKESIAFAQTSREVTAKAYQLGEADYTQLLQSEIRLQQLRLHEVRLRAKRDQIRLQLKALRGEELK